MQIYFNELSGTTAFALIEKHRRIWGIDFNDMKGWHLHPLENPENHINIDEKSIEEILNIKGFSRSVVAVKVINAGLCIHMRAGLSV